MALRENNRPSRLLQPGSFLKKPAVIVPSAQSANNKRKSGQEEFYVDKPAKRAKISPNTTHSGPAPKTTAPRSVPAKLNASKPPALATRSAVAKKPSVSAQAPKPTPKPAAPVKSLTSKAPVTKDPIHRNGVQNHCTKINSAPKSKFVGKKSPPKAPIVRPPRPEVVMRKLQASNATLEEEKEAMQGEIEQLKCILEESKQDLANKAESISNLEASNQCHLTTIRGLEAAINKRDVTLKNEMREAKMTQRRLQNTIEELKTQKAALEADVNDRTAEIAELQETITARENDLQELEKKLEEARLTQQSLRNSMSELQSQLEERRLDIAARDVSITNLTDSNRAHMSTIQDRDITISERDLTIAALEAKIREGEMMRRRLHNTIQELKGNIRVFCRVRPLLGEEAAGAVGDDEISHMTFPADGKTLELARLSDVGVNESVMSQSGRGGKTGKYVFQFDNVFSPRSTQGQVFSEISQVVQSALDGYSVCIFAYGQTGSGKTYTMEGPQNPTPDTWGMIPRAVSQVFISSEALEEQGWKYEFEASFLEIYNETIRDLLGNKKDVKHEIKMVSANSTEVIVTNLTTTTVTSPQQVHRLLKKASENRAVAETKVNERSSRSHSVFRLLITGHNTHTEEKCSGYLNLIDLAGSERLKESQSEGERLRETKNINSSLANLSNCIMALGNKDSHVPYRNSKLTHLLSNSLGGSSKVLMFLNLSPREECFSESLNSLRFATKVNNCHIGTAQKKSGK